MLLISDLCQAGGVPAPHGRLVLLYLNGLLWGLYDLHERPDEHFCASYFGGDDDDYDVLKHSSSQVVSGDSTAYRTLTQLSGNSPLSQVRTLVNGTALAVYWLVNVWAGNTDWDHHVRSVPFLNLRARVSLT